jgi:predicted PurR-regulated permease PerM
VGDRRVLAAGAGLISAVLAWVPFVGSILGCVLVVVVATTDAPSNP